MTSNQGTIDDLPTVARLYYTGHASRRYKRASVQDGPGEPLCFVSTAKYYIRIRDAEINRLREALLKAGNQPQGGEPTPDSACAEQAGLLRDMRNREMRYMEEALMNIRRQDGEGARESANDTLAWLRNRMAVIPTEERAQTADGCGDGVTNDPSKVKCPECGEPLWTRSHFHARGQGQEKIERENGERHADVPR